MSPSESQGRNAMRTVARTVGLALAGGAGSSLLLASSAWAKSTAEPAGGAPLANPAHFLILGGLFTLFVAGFVSIVLPRERPGAAAVRITRSWHAPLGGVLLFACAAFALFGFPLDDAWHRLFGQDVTLWGPTHLMLFGGAAMTLIGRSVLLVEGARVARERTGRRGSGMTPFYVR